MRYFKKNWEETTGDELTDDWGVSIFYFETDDSLNVFKQIQIFENGNILKYDELNNENEFGAMADQSLEEKEFLDCEITKEEFNSKDFPPFLRDNFSQTQ